MWLLSPWRQVMFSFCFFTLDYMANTGFHCIGTELNSFPLWTERLCGLKTATRASICIGVEFQFCVNYPFDLSKACWIKTNKSINQQAFKNTTYMYVQTHFAACQRWWWWSQINSRQPASAPWCHRTKLWHFTTWSHIKQSHLRVRQCRQINKQSRRESSVYVSEAHAA